VNARILLAWLLVGTLGLTFFIAYFDRTYPFASIDIKVSRDEAVEIASDFIARQGFDLEGFDRTVIFYSDFYDSAYLQKTQGIERIGEYIRQGIPVWFWRVRWFKELEKEGFVAAVDPRSGEVVRFNHFVLETDEGADLDPHQARALAETYLIAQGLDLSEYELKESEVEKQKKRTDHSFSWEKKDYAISDATLRIEVRIYGDTVGKYLKQLKVPEKFQRYVQQEVALGKMLTKLTEIGKALMAVVAVFLLVLRNREQKVHWRFWLFWGGLVVIFYTFNFANRMPLVWSMYNDAMSKAVFIVNAVGEHFMRMFSIGLMIFAYGLLGEFFARKYALSRFSLYDIVRRRVLSGSQKGSILVAGYCLGFVFLGYMTLFYLIATKFFHVWIYPNTVYSNMLGTKMPFLFPLTLALGAAIHEEFAFRLFAIPFLKRLLRWTWLAVLGAALLWGYAHSFYLIFPMYVRGIELTVFGVILGIVFLRFGVATVIIGHFVANAILASLPLLRSHNPYFVLSGFLVISFVLLPIVFMAIIPRAQSHQRAGG
jgi:hypothetical protein